MPSLLEPAPKRLRTKVERPLSIRQTTEIAVRRGKGYWGILENRGQNDAGASGGELYLPFPKENTGELQKMVSGGGYRNDTRQHTAIQKKRRFLWFNVPPKCKL